MFLIFIADARVCLAAIKMKKVSSDPGLISANDPVGFSFTRARKQSSQTRQNVKKTQDKKAKREVGSCTMTSQPSRSSL